MHGSWQRAWQLAAANHTPMLGSSGAAVGACIHHGDHCVTFGVSFAQRARLMAGTGGGAGGGKPGSGKAAKKSVAGVASKPKRGSTGGSAEGGAKKKTRLSKEDATHDHVTWLGTHNHRSCPVIESADQEAGTVIAVGKFECR